MAELVGVEFLRQLVVFELLQKAGKVLDLGRRLISGQLLTLDSRRDVFLFERNLVFLFERVENDFLPAVSLRLEGV